LVIPRLYLVLALFTFASALTPALLAQTSVPLPAPAEWAASSARPAAPGDALVVTFTGAAPAPGAPVISGWNLTLKPDESFTLGGIRFTARIGADAGTDTTVWLCTRGIGV
jgi:hypothetical protein